ncbi:MAG: adenylate/guanylate cyclase domain-containing protein [Desulfobacterales bacterium]|nr:adenylate/guanylate cyclase domain-containing protein [Desulfobacterales bacterium]
MNTSVIQQKIKALLKFNILDSKDVERFGIIIEKLSDWDLFRINPIRFANDHAFDTKSMIDIFIYAAKIGMLDFEWDMICPLCGAVIYNYDTIGEIKFDSYHCAMCDIDVKTDLSDFVEVSFNIDPSIEKLNLNPFADVYSYFKYFISPNFQMPPAFIEHYKLKGMRAFRTINPGDVTEITFSSNPNELYRLISLDTNSILRLQFNHSICDISQIIEIDALPSCLSPDTLNLPAGNITLRITNHLARVTGFVLNFWDVVTISSIFKDSPLKQYPFLTGKQLLNNQSFRDLFRIQTLPNDLRLKVSNITILFTDLKGSTELYEKTGDMFAYNLVQRHFELLKESTKKFSGAIVKTIGDAIMASFSTPIDGLLAAIDMTYKIKTKMNDTDKKGHEVAIKVGLNVGTAIVVTANETLDYFGQTVNIAARVQGLAEAGEIWVASNAYNFDTFNDIMQKHGFNIEKKSAYLKGVSQPTNVYKCYSML